MRWFSPTTFHEERSQAGHDDFGMVVIGRCLCEQTYVGAVYLPQEMCKHTSYPICAKPRDAHSAFAL